MLSDLLIRLRALFQRKAVENELADELRFHFEQQVEKLVRSGLPPPEARRRARLVIGGSDQIKEECRDARGVRFIETLAQDIRYGLRMLRKSPVFTAVAVLTLALGIGANTAIFTLTYAVILKSLPVPNPEQLVRYTFRNGSMDIGLSGPEYDALSKHESVDSGILAWAQKKFAVKMNGAVRSVTGALLSGNGFRVLELRPFLGRPFGEADDVSGGGPNGYQALLGYDYWRTHFHSSPSALGRTLTVNGRAVTVAGVLPRGFDGLIAGQRADLVLPLAFDEVINAQRPLRKRSGAFWLTVIGRLKTGETLKAASANLQATVAAVRKEADPKGLFLHGFFAPFRLGVESGRAGRSFLKVAYEQPLLALEILVGFVLVLCCANTALLMLARVSSRYHEFGVRSALGASRRRLLQQVLVEAGLLAGCGLVLGIALGWAGARSLVTMMATIGQPPPIDATPRAVILVFTAGISVLSALAAGLWPAWRASLVDPAPGLKQAAARSSLKGMGGWLVPGQVALSVILLVSASLLGGTFLRLLLQNSGFRASNVVLADVGLGANKSASAKTFVVAKEMVAALGSAPGVEAATAMSDPPIDGWYSASHLFSIGAHGVVHTDLRTWPELVLPDYYRVMGTRILQGRPFDPADDAGPRVCILSASAARYFFPGEGAIGKVIYSGGSNPALDGKGKLDTKDSCRVIGVAEDARFRSLRVAPPRMLYEPFGQEKWGTEFFLAARSRSLGLAVAALRDSVRRVAPTAVQPIVFTFNDLVDQNLRTERMLMALSVCFGAMALLLTTLGLYGLLTRSVVVRTHEIGIRMALGAQPRDVLRLVSRQGLILVGAGVAIGVVASLALTRFLDSLLFEINPTGPATFVAVAVLLMLVALVACYIPARRAMKVDPMVALRHE